MLITDNTICAISTAHGMGAIATIRVAGPEAIEITDGLFRSPSGKKLRECKGGTFHFGTFADGDDDIDEVVVAVYRKPHSFTGEDVTEISCHGSMVIQNKILQSLIRHGAHTAAPGEFTQRAFANGKMDLSQAEAVADLIASQNDNARKVALQQMRGGFSQELKHLRTELMEFASLIELELDFSEEDVEFADRTQLIGLISKIDTLVTKLANSFSLGNAIKNGIPVAIVGPTNAGKSTLLNALLNEERAIVSDVHGTTRDAIEDTVVLGGLTFRFIDTAGLRKTDDKVENIGIGLTYNKIEKSDIVLLTVDATEPRDKILAAVADAAEHIDTRRQKLVIVANKSDIGHAPAITAADAEALHAFGMVHISAKNRVGLEQLTAMLASAVDTRALDANQTIVTNARHYEALLRSHEALVRIDQGLRTNLSGELIALDLHEVLDHLAGITGEVTSQEVLNNIFSKFCIGK